MAVNNETKTTTATVRRLFFGANVLVVVLLATVVLAAVNWIGHSHNKRKDLAGGLSAHRVSERTKGILNQLPGEMTITTVYTSDEPDSDRKTYLPRLQDYLEEMSEYKRSVKIEHLHGGNERANLRDRIQNKFSTAAVKYKDVVDSAGQTWDRLKGVLASLDAQTKGIGGSWLSGFTVFAGIQNDLRKDLQEIEDVRREVTNLVQGEGIPRYQEANTKIKEANDNFKQHLERLQTWTKDTSKLVDVLSQSNSGFATQSRINLKVMEGLLLNLRKGVGDLDSREAPADPVPVIKDYAKAANTLSKWLFDENNRVSTFVKENPTLEQHPKWNVRVQVSVFDANLPMQRLLEQCSQQLSQNVEVLRQVLADPSSVGDLELKNLVVDLRQNTAQTDKMLRVWSDRLNAVLADAGKIDDSSRQFLTKGVSGELFAAPVSSTQPEAAKQTKSIIDQLSEIGSKINELPKLELDEIAEKMKDDNIVVIETDKLVRIVPFDEVWPVAAPDAVPYGQDKGKQYRIFDGDRAVSSAVNGLINTQKLATVILVGYEMQPPQQQQQQMRQPRPITGPIPFSQLKTLEEKFTKANFSVKQWNLGAMGPEAMEGRPKPDEGTKAIYLIVPPAETPPSNPMMQQAPPPSFGPEELKQVKEALSEKDARAIFLTISDPMPRPPYAPPASYAFRDMLREDWGVDVRFEYRVIRGIRDLQRPDHFNIDIAQWRYMPLSSFTDHPIGKPLKARRMLMQEVCPIMSSEKLPDGVKVESVLDVPASSQDIWADSDIMRIIKPLMEGQRDSTFTRGPPALDKRLPGTCASENSKTGGKVIVLGNGASFIDSFLSRPVMHLGGKRGAMLTTDPAPMENVDLMLNSVFWLADQPNMIAAGPAALALVGDVNSANQASASIISFGWAFVVLILGVVVMFVRRK